MLGCANQEALDKLRTALSKATAGSSNVELVVARRMGNPGSSLSPSMAALGEEPEEVSTNNNSKIDFGRGQAVHIVSLVKSTLVLLHGKVDYKTAFKWKN